MSFIIVIYIGIRRDVKYTLYNTSSKMYCTSLKIADFMFMYKIIDI